jgi:AraC-like DNA-binding protein
MKTPRRPLYVLHGDPLLRGRIHRAAARQFETLPVTCWDALWWAVNGAPSTAVSIVDPYHGDPSRASPALQLRDLIRSFPSVPVVGVMEAGTGRVADARTLGEWGVVMLFGAGAGAETIRRVLDGTEGHALRALLAHALPATVSARARVILIASLDAMATGGQVGDLAYALHLSPRTLLRRSQELSLPTPRHLLAWMRVLLAAELLDQPGRSVGSVALTCGYASDTGLRRVLHDVLGATPQALRDAGAFAIASTLFLRVLADVNEGGEHAIAAAASVALVLSTGGEPV